MNNAARMIGKQVKVNGVSGTVLDVVYHWQSETLDFFTVEMPDGNIVNLLVADMVARVDEMFSRVWGK